MCAQAGSPAAPSLWLWDKVQAWSPEASRAQAVTGHFSSWLTQSWRVVASLPLAPLRPHDSGIPVCQGGWHGRPGSQCDSSPESVWSREAELMEPWLL